ncbi:MAG: cob(I)yrinic acid a,c-diamide adenosyltransferase [Rikenellaceae bacterium]
MKIYTKTGDKGTTALIGGDRVPKDDIRVEAYGTVDELTAFIGLLGDKLTNDDRTANLVEELHSINSMLMNVEAHLASSKGTSYTPPQITDESIIKLEAGIDRMQSKLPVLTNFTIPGGSEAISLCHICRTICRRAERRSITVAEHYEIDESVVKYLNRLSDYLYLLGRTSAYLLDVEEVLWRP